MRLKLLKCEPDKEFWDIYAFQYSSRQKFYLDYWKIAAGAIT